MKSEIVEDASEFDVRYRIIKYLVERLLGYEGKDYQAEKNRTDIKILDETHTLPLVVIETKRPTINLREEKWKKQAFGYTDAFTKYVVLTNGLQLLVWRKTRRQKPFIELNFGLILTQRKLTPEKLTVREKSQILALSNLSKDNLWSETKYQDFYVSEKINIADSEGFAKLLETLGYIMNQLLMGYSLRAFDEYFDGYTRFEGQYRSLEEETKRIKGSKEFELRWQKEKRDLEENFRRYVRFYRGYTQWLYLSGREDSNESREIFCKETIYVLLNKILLVRICEDKGLVTKKISNNGIRMWREFAGYLKDSYRDLLDVAYKDTSNLYSHVYEKGIFDWYADSNGELNKVLNKVLYILNHFDFNQVNRDILGKLYEKYLPREERKRLGEFYTPDEVIDYILDAIGYSSKCEIEGRDLLDPACGSGGFLVRATIRLIERYKSKGLASKEIINNVANHIYGFDINPFACHIAEMNLLFQIIDLYQKAKNEDSSYMLPRFNIYQTDSLELPLELSKGGMLPRQSLVKWVYPNSRVRKYVEEKEAVEKIKTKKFDFVVGNPPYVRIEKISAESRDYYKDNYQGARGRFDLYMLFIERGLEWLENNGRLGFITSNRFMKTDTGKKLRGLITKNSKIEQIVDFGDISLFEAATNYPCIFVLQKEEPADNVVWFAQTRKWEENMMTRLRDLFTKEISDEFLRAYLVEQKMLTEDIWRPKSGKAHNLFKKLEKVSDIRLRDIVVWNLNGIFTGLNDVFIVKQEIVDKYQLEPEIAKPLLVGEDVRRWKLSWSGNYILYTKEIDFEKQKNAFGYLKEHKERLSKRKSIQGTGIKWYELSRPRDRNAFESKKIVTPRIATGNNFALDDNGRYCGDTTYVIIPEDDVDIYYLLGLLNSKVLDFYLKQVSPFLMDKYYVYNASYTGRLPIKLPRTKDEKKSERKIRECVKEILELADAKAEISIKELAKRFDSLRLDDHPLIVLDISVNEVKMIKREDNRVFLNMVDFLECKEESVALFVEQYLKEAKDELKTTKNLRKDICGIRVPRKKEDIEKVVQEYEALKAKMKTIPRQIEDAAHRIDQEVLKLYRVSRKEMKIIEAFS